MCQVVVPTSFYIQEMEFSTESQFRTYLLRALRNRQSYEMANFVTSGYYHSIFAIRVYQSEYVCPSSQTETVTRLIPISVLRVVELAGCESRTTQSSTSPTVASCASALQAIVTCISNASSQSSVVRLQQLFVPCPLTLFLRDQLIPTRKEAIIVFHTISSLFQDFDSVVCALNDLKKICLVRSEHTKTGENDDCWNGIELCEKCSQKKTIIEERIRNTVVKEVYSRSQNVPPTSNNKDIPLVVRSSNRE